MMSRSDYKVIADALRSIQNDLIRNSAISVLGKALKKDNGRFDLERFYAACKPDATQGS